MSPPHCSRHNMCQGWFLSRGWGVEQRQAVGSGCYNPLCYYLLDFSHFRCFQYILWTQSFFKCKKSKSVKVHRHVCSVTAVCLSAPARVRPRPRPAMVSSALSPCSEFPPRRTPPPPAADAVNREIYAERRAAAAAESRNTRSFAPTPPGLVFMVYPRPLPAMTIIYSISTVYLLYIYSISTAVSGLWPVWRGVKRAV